MKGIILLAFAFFYESSTFGKNIEKYEIKIKKISFKTLEKKIRENQERYLAVTKQIELYKEKRSSLKKRHIEQIKKKQTGTSKKSEEKALSLLQLSLIDNESLESRAEQDLLLDYYKKMVSKRVKREKAQEDYLDGREELDSKILALEKMAKTFLLKLKKDQKNKLILQAEITKTEQSSGQRKFLNEIAIQRKKNLSKEKNLEKGKIFVEPIIDYHRYYREDGGLEFECLGKCMIQAPATGHVVYINELPPYGMVIMLEHSAGFRSVFLGDLSLDLKKGDKVFQGEKIAQSNSNQLAKIYFELRQHNEIKDILSYISFY